MSSGVGSNKCIDVSFIRRHFGDSRGLIKIGSIEDDDCELEGRKENVVRLYSCYKSALGRQRRLSAVLNGDIFIMIVS